jgi:hypothetical protein
VYGIASADEKLLISSGRGRAELFGSEACTVRQWCSVHEPAGPARVTARSVPMAATSAAPICPAQLPAAS